MIWIHAGSNVAMVANTQSIRNWSLVDFPTQAVRGYGLTVERNVSIAGFREDGSGPEPTTAVSVKLNPAMKPIN
jgi:hypothetical protein